jgi:hypothetical protein
MALASCSKDSGPARTRGDAPPFHTESTAYVRHEKDTWTYVTENSSFHFTQVLGDKGAYEPPLLIEESYHNENTPGIEGTRGDATIWGWTIGSHRDRELRWTIHDTGNGGDIHGRFFRLVVWACCDAPSVFTYYSLLSGEKLYVTNSDLLEVKGAGEGPLATRYVGFGYDSRNNPARGPQLQYGTDRDVPQRFSVESSKKFAEPPELFLAVDSVVQKSLDLSHLPMNFFVVLRYPGGTELRIPVEDDTLRPDKAVVPAGFSIHP